MAGSAAWPRRPTTRPCVGTRRRPPGGGERRPAVAHPLRWPRLATPPSPPPSAVPPADAAGTPPSFHATAPAPTLRCALCYELGFPTRGALADHLVGPAHTRHWGPVLVAAGRAARAGDADAAAAAAAAAAGITCPYCGEPAPLGGRDVPASYHPMRWLRRHVSGGECRRGKQRGERGDARPPDPVACFEPPPPAGSPPWVDLRDAAAFPRYAPLLSLPCPPRLAASLGAPTASTSLTIRPLHPSRAHALATVLTAAFASDPDPPTYAWLARELAREAARFEWEGGAECGGLVLGSGSVALPTRPLPSDTCRTAGGAGGGAPRWWRVGRGRQAVDGGGSGGGPEAAATAPPGRRAGAQPSTGAGPSTRRAGSSEAAEEDDDEWRVRLEEAWGRWLWLVAEVEVEGEEGPRRDAHDARVLGGAALLLHDRSPALDALRSLDPPGSPTSMDFALWLTSDPSPAATAGCGGRGGWLWWAGVDPRARRAGVGAALVSAAEIAVAGLGLEALYVQALAPPRTAPDGGLGLLAGLMGGEGGGGGKRGDPGAAARALYERAGYSPLPPPTGTGPALAVPWWGGGRARPAVDASAVMLGKALGLDGGWWEERP